MKVPSWLNIYICIKKTTIIQDYDYHQETLVGVDGADKDGHVVALAVLVLRPDFGVVLRRVRLSSRTVTPHRDIFTQTENMCNIQFKYGLYTVDAL